MSLFGSIQLANNSLRAMQVGLQVVGQNIANVNTPGYIREEAQFAPAPTQRSGDLLLGLGVEVKGIVQKIDLFLESRLRSATSDVASADVQEETYLQLEGLIGELGDTDLSTSLNKFFSSISEVLNQPESTPIRNLAILQGQTLAGDFNRLASRVRNVRSDLNDRVISTADDINRLAEEIRTLNLRISSTEGGNNSGSEAVGLRDLRLVALTKLSELIDIRVEEQASGGVSVFTGGAFLVFEGRRRAVDVALSTDRGLSVAEVQLAETQSPIETSGGELAGLYEGRDTILAGFLDDLDQFTGTLAFEFNKVFSTGQGLTGFDQVTSDFSVDAGDLALNAAGLDFTPTGGTFDVLVYNRNTQLTETNTVLIDLDGLDQDTTLESLRSTLEAIDGISAMITSTGQLTLRSESADLEFAFSGDTSGVLAALGINTFFSGSTAGDLGVNQVLVDDASKFAASRGGIGEDSRLAEELVALFDRPLEATRGSSIADTYGQLISNVTQGSTVARSVAEGFRVFQSTLEGQKLATSGVSLDEEAVKMLSFQHAYQASARYIATLAELLEILVNL